MDPRCTSFQEMTEHDSEMEVERCLRRTYARGRISRGLGGRSRETRSTSGTANAEPAGCRLIWSLPPKSAARLGF
jgi:hypothetical protein